MNDESLIIKCNIMLYPDEIGRVREDIINQLNDGVVILPPGFELVRKNAHWVRKTETHKMYKSEATFESLKGYFCSNCNAEALAEYASDEADYALSNYCPNCGAFMSEHISELKGENKP